MFTSNFSKQGKNINAVSIAAKAPSWYTGREYKKLAPPYWLLDSYKKNGDKEFYTTEYTKIILDKLSVMEVYRALGKDAILLCYESEDAFCHRHIVAKWIKEKLDIDVKEI